MSSPRERFVEAMHLIVGAYGNETGACEDYARQAVEAFADAECGLTKAYKAERGPCCKSLHADCSCHAACRAALLKECGLE